MCDGIQVEICDRDCIGSSGNGEEETFKRQSVRANAITGVGTNEPQYPQGAVPPSTP